MLRYVLPAISQASAGVLREEAGQCELDRVEFGFELNHEE